MNDTDSVKVQPTVDRDSTNSANRLIYDNSSNYNVDDEQISDRKSVSTENTEEDTETLEEEKEPSPPQSPADKPSFGGAFGISIAATIIWYICICILLLISFVCLVLSTLYFVSTSTDDILIKLYGIGGSGSLAIVTFAIVFLDCCNHQGITAQDEEILYKELQAKEAEEKERARRRGLRIPGDKVEKPKPFIIQHQRPQKVAAEPPPHRPPLPPPPPPPPPPPHRRPHRPHRSHRSHRPPQPPHRHHHHHFPLHPPTAHQHPFFCPVCRDLHVSGDARHSLNDVAVDTSDKFAPVLRKNQTVHKSTRDAQTQPKLWDAERGTQTDRTEGTQTSTMELSGMPSNVTQIIHETTILKAPRNLIRTLKKSMKEQDKDIAMTHAISDTNSTPKTII